MSRTATFEVLAGDTDLNDLGFDNNSIYHNWTIEERPNPTSPFMLLQWGDEDPPPFLDPDSVTRSAERLSIWIHYPQEMKKDHITIKQAFDKVDNVFRQTQDVVGVDGYTLSHIVINGRSGDLFDDGFNTITKNASYEIHYR